MGYYEIMNKYRKYISIVESKEYEKFAWNNWDKGNQQIWNKWASRLRFVATILKPYLNQKKII